MVFGIGLAYIQGHTYVQKYLIGYWIGSIPTCCFICLLFNMMVSLGIGISDWIWVYLIMHKVQKCRNWGVNVLDWKLDWIISYVLFNL